MESTEQPIEKSKRRAIVRRALMLSIVLGIVGIFYWNAFYNDRLVAHEVDASGIEHVTLLSRSHTIDRIYLSMQGPFSNHAEITLIDSPKPELLWVTGIHAELVGRDGQTPAPRDFFCHSNLCFNLSNLRSQRTGSNSPFTATQDFRLFTLIPGRMNISLPEGFGLPIYSDEPLDYFSMSLNLNEKTGSRDVRFKTAIDFVRDASVAKNAPMKPLFRRALYGYETIGKEIPLNLCVAGPGSHAACGPFVGKEASSNAFVASIGKTNTVHWYIPPGYYESRVPVNVQLDLPYDTTVHYLSAHLHPYGKSVALFDKTAQQTVFEIRATDFTNRLGVDSMEQQSLPQGVALTKSHEYELVTTYDNPTSQPIDAMSIMYLYCFDKTFASREGSTKLAMGSAKSSSTMR